jgi:hypothetical protein
MNPLEIVSLSLDILLVAAAVASYLARPRIGGQLAKGLRVLMAGVMALGLAHFVETMLFAQFNLDRQVNEVVHRLLIAAGFACVIVGFYIMRRAFDR